MTKLSHFKKTTRAAVAALVIGAASISAMPAQAANNVTFGFSFGTNGTTTYSSQAFQSPQATQVHHRNNWERQNLNNRQIRRGLREHGFRNIKFANQENRRVRVTAVRGGWKYKLRVNRRNGNIKVLDRNRIHHGGGRNGRGSFQLHFNFR